VVASATRDNRQLIAVVLGAPSSGVRAAKAAYMFETAFNSAGLNWLMPSLGTVEGLQPINAAPPNLREAMCGKHRRRPAAEAADDEEDQASGTGTGSDEPGSLASLFFNAKANGGPKPSSLVAATIAANPPIEVYVGPTRRPRDPAVAAARPFEDKTPAPARGKPTGASDLVALPGRSDAAIVPTPRPRPAASKAKRPAAKPAITAAKPLPPQ
jgi:D-alanyl-D-alanine carboxypeptidase